MKASAAVALALLGLAASALAQDIILEPNYEFDEKYRLFDIRSGLVLTCNVKNEATPGSAGKLKWYKDGEPVETDTKLEGRYTIKPDENTLFIQHTLESDGGKWMCELGTKSATIIAVAKPVPRIPPNTSVVEGDTLKLVCAALGNPKPTVEWRIGNDTFSVSTDRIVLSDENDVVNAVLTINKVVMEDRGSYYCKATNIASSYVNTTEDFTYVRVKDSLAALWPFLGICAEVFILCAIILIYEKRRTKPELEESDTDQSPDQKHTPDHGKDRDIRHRK